MTHYPFNATIANVTITHVNSYRGNTTLKALLITTKNHKRVVLSPEAGRTAWTDVFGKAYEDDYKLISTGIIWFEDGSWSEWVGDQWVKYEAPLIPDIMYAPKYDPSVILKWFSELPKSEQRQFLVMITLLIYNQED